MLSRQFLGICLISLIFLTLLSSVSAQQLEGDGTEFNPYTLNECEDLRLIENNQEAVFELSNDIDCSESRNWNDGKGFEPVEFSGVLRGNGYRIQNLYIRRPDSDYIGLFGQTHGAVISSLKLIEPEIIGGHDTGALIGEVFPIEGRTAVSDVGVEGGTVHGTNNTGGMIGTASNLKAERISFSGTVEGERNTGGLIGTSEVTVQTANMRSQVLVRSSYSDASVTSTANVGGLIGDNRETVESSKFNGTVEGVIGVGGITGMTLGGTMNRVLSDAEVNGEDRVGGITGELVCGGEIAGSGTTSEVTGSEQTGEVTGYIYMNSGMCSENRITDTLTTNEADEAVGSARSDRTVRVESANAERIREELGFDEIGPRFGTAVREPETPELEGEGKAADPYRISTCEDLKEIEKDLDGHYVLTENIVCEKYRSSIEKREDIIEQAEDNQHLQLSGINVADTLSNISDPHRSIGSDSRDFEGVLDGKGRSISYLYIKDDTGSGLLSVISGELKNLEIKNSLIDSQGENAFIAGTVSKNGVVSNISIHSSEVKTDGNSRGDLAGLVVENRGLLEDIYLDLKLYTSSHSNFQTVGSPAAILTQKNKGTLEDIYWTENTGLRDDSRPDFRIPDTGIEGENQETVTIGEESGTVKNLENISVTASAEKFEGLNFDSRWTMEKGSPSLKTIRIKNSGPEEEKQKDASNQSQEQNFFTKLLDLLNF